MKTTTLASLALALTMGGALAPVQARAQFDFGNGGGGDDSRPAISGFKLNPKKTLKLDFRNANVDAVLSLFQKASGVTIVKDPSLTGGITLTSAKAVPLKDAFQILETTLGLKGYEMRKEGNLLVIAQRRQRDQGQQSPPFDPSIFQQQSETRVYPIKFANASQVARVVNDVFGGQQTGGGFGGFGGFGGGRGGGGNQQQQQQRFQQFAQRFGQQQVQVRASADDFSNSVIVNAPSKNQRDVSDLIAKIDKETDQPQNSRIYKLVYASATDAAAVLQNVLQANAPRGRGGATTQQQQQNNLPAFLRGGQTQGTGTVVADTRTNSVVVTAIEENQKIVQQVITELDKPVELASTTFVFPLQNARADEVADLLNQAFGQRTGTNGNRRTTAATPSQQRQNQSNNARTNRNTAVGRARAENTIQIPLEDPDAESGELLTSVSVQQGGAFGQFFGQNQNRNGQQNTNQTARTSDGRIVNVNDLTNQITVIPDQNTNSVIVVAAPGSADLVQQIIGQLDRIPEQVMIETIIVEATLSDATKLGVEFGLNVNDLTGSGGNGTVGTGFGLQTSPLPIGGRVSLTGGNLTAFINALRTDSRFNVLSTPRIFTTNNQQAQINISQSIPYVLSTRQDTLGGIQYNYDFLDVGIVLTVTPRITANGYVTMDVNQTANELQEFTSFNAPIVNQREANTTVSVLDGETIVLGGIIRNSVTATTNKVPILGDIPILGNIFRSTTKTNGKTELLVLLRPRIVRDDAEARALRRESQERLSLPTREQLKKVLPPEDGPITSPTEPDKDPGSGAAVPPGKDPTKPKDPTKDPTTGPTKPPTDPTKKTPPPSTPK